ncbi:hypothetical protein [Agromyces albus]|uniref:Uncharacterized protein n=1 Tax=Agromyces albus TaxID=205332 RepID=A0A4Q2KTR5_9MICO|nr:hypothetical protein [Agromyces albus]RXZ68147.1 hypothetical protein ESP51_14930 [Agromyces albus]
MTEEPRQRVERAAGRARRAKLTPAPGSDPSPESPVPGAESADGAEGDERAPKRKRAASADDDRISRERPPHWG